MLKKLLKYDLLDMYKVLIIFYILSLVFGIITRIFFNIENSVIFNIIAQVFSGITISMMINILINNLMRVWARFTKNLYGDESYLTHTLPVEKKTIYLSKFLSSIITMFTSVLVIGVTIFIAYYSQENFEILKNMLIPLADVYNTSIIGLVVPIFLVFFLEMAVLLQAGYAGIILGHRKNNNKIVYSIIYGFVCYMLTQVFVLAIVFVAGLFNSDIMNLFTTNEISDMSLLKLIMYLALAIYAVCIVIYYVICRKLFNKGVNVD